MNLLEANGTEQSAGYQRFRSSVSLGDRIGNAHCRVWLRISDEPIHPEIGDPYFNGIYHAPFVRELNLMIGKNILWIAKQHGHSTVTMLRTYAAWVEGAADADVEAIKRSMYLLPDPAYRPLVRWAKTPIWGSGFVHHGKSARRGPHPGPLPSRHRSDEWPKS